MDQQTNDDKTIKPRYDWYETDQSIVIGIMIKNIDQNNVNVEFRKNYFKFNYKTNNDEQKYELKIDLNGEIIAEKSNWKVTTVKAEIKLCKISNYRWEKLEASSSNNQTKICNQPMNSLSSSDSSNNTTTTTTKARNWDDIARQIEKDEQENDDGVEALFRRIYSSGDENLRRAMNKSFVESNGTVLSTNWNEVGKSKVEMKPPDNCEYRKWDS